MKDKDKYKEFNISVFDKLAFPPVLSGWHTLQPQLGKTEDVAWCKRLIHFEIATANRQFIISRISSRIIKLKGEEERKWLDEFVKNKISEYGVKRKSY